MLSPAEIERAFDLDEQFKHVDEIFDAGVSSVSKPGSSCMRARVFVTLKPSVFDPQGQTIADALHSLGYGARRGRAAGQVLRARPGDDRSRRRPRRSPRKSPTSCWRTR